MDHFGELCLFNPGHHLALDFEAGFGELHQVIELFEKTGFVISESIAKAGATDGDHEQIHHQLRPIAIGSDA